jgi:hypothetical protein
MSRHFGYFCVDLWNNIGLVSENQDPEYCTFSIAHNVDLKRKHSSIKRKATIEEIRLAGFEGVGCKNVEDLGKETA